MLATYFVDTSIDIDTGICAPDNAAGNIDCSIRPAILAVEDSPGPDAVRIPDGTYLIDAISFGSFDVSGGGDLSIVGNGLEPIAVVIHGVGSARVLDIIGALPVSIQGMTIQNEVARDGSGGGGINAALDVDLFVNNVILQDNLADRHTFFNSPTDGGATQASVNVTLSNSQMFDNVATDNGGAIHFVPLDGNGRTLDISNTTISGNSAGDSSVDGGVGGGVFVDGSDATAVFDTVLISNKEAGDSGGGVYSFESGLSVTDSTFTGNMALGSDSGGGGLDVLGAGLVSPAFCVIGGLLNSNTAIQGAGGFESVDNAGSIDGTTFTLNQVVGTGTTFREGDGGIAVISTCPVS